SEPSAGHTVAPAVGPVLGRLPSGVFILTTRAEHRETGMLISWVMQAGFQPPAVTVAIRKDRYVSQWLTDGCAFVLNLLEHGQSRLLRHFARGFPPDARPFVDLDIVRSSSGIALLREAMGHIECMPRCHVDSGDHRIFLADVTGGKLEFARNPMVHIRRSGMNY